MLGGLDPLIIINLPTILPDALKNAVAGIPVLSDAVGVGVPIPIYLSESLTGIALASESKSVAIETDVQATQDASKPKVKQNAIDSVVVVNLEARSDSVFLSVFLALADIIFTRAATGQYSVSYLNGATVVFDALIKSVSVTGDNNSELMQVAIEISKANLKSSTNPPPTTALNPVVGA